jgi:hypothetical protein
MTPIGKSASGRRRNAGFPVVAAAALVLAAGLAGCRRERLPFDAGSAADDGRTPACFSPGDTISLAVHETAVRSDGRFAVRLDSVIEDSRCPVDVVCVWEGNCRLAFTAAGPDRAVRIELNTHAGSVRDTVVAGVYIGLVNVLPAPVSKRRIPPDEYRAVVTVR